jgi:hypothetical protein
MVYSQTKNPICVYFGALWNGKCIYLSRVYILSVYILSRFGIFYGHLVYIITAIWYTYFVVLWYIFPVLVCCNEKNLATLFAK